MLSIIISIALLTENTQLKKELQTTKTSLENLENSYTALYTKSKNNESTIEELREKVQSYEAAVVFVNERYRFYVDGGYHYINCSKIVHKGASSYTSKNNVVSEPFCSCNANYNYGISRLSWYKNHLP